MRTDDLLRRADALLSASRLGEATDAYRAVLARNPRHADAWFNLGYLLRRAGRFDDALDAYARALEAGVASPEEARLNRAAILSGQLQRDDEALAELQAGLDIAPRHPASLLNLGNLHEQRGEREAAIACYERLLALGDDTDGLHLEALARLAGLRPPRDPDDPILAALRRAAGAAGAPDASRANLLFALGRGLDTLGAHDEAFAAFASANRHAHRGAAAYDAARARARTDAIIDAFPSPAPRHATRDDGDGPAPLFICGMFRSGSTLLEQVLAGHPMVAQAGELELLPRMAATELAPFPQALAGVDDGRLDGLARSYLASVRSLLPDGGAGYRYVTDKRPDNYAFIGLAKRLFPRARFLHTCRDPMDNGLSVYMQHLNPRRFDYAGTLASIGHHYGEYRRLMAHWKALYPGDIHDFDYDAFVADPRRTLAPLLAFLGLDWDDALLDFHRRGNSVRTASDWQVRRPLYGDASGRWRRYRHHLGPLAEALAAAGVPLPG